MKYIIILFLTFVFCLTNTYQFSLGLRKEQSVGAKGITLCNGKPFEMVNIQLFEKDRNSFNDLMNRQYSDYFGRFSLYGSEKEFNTITPLIIIEHQCNTKGKEKQKIEYRMDNSYITVGSIPAKYCDLGTVELANATEIQCL